jgi:glutamate/tyrosine decarboxylase-like PLP-dependent enzyme
MVELPLKRTPAESVLKRMGELRQDDARWREGKTWSLVYNSSDELIQFTERAFAMFMTENAFNPMAFPSLRGFEVDVVSMTAGLLGGDAKTVGNMTSGGTESILMAVKTARDWARVHKPAISTPEMILPQTAHPAFEKAAQYFSVRSVRVPVHSDFRAHVAAASAAITTNTILMIGSAPSYPHGVLDPIEELAQVAQAKGLLFHVDACIGGMMLPFVRKLGYPLPDFGFQVPGVTSLSVDLHKYGYAAKGASVILYREKELRRHQFSAYTDWPGGVYASPTMTGTRPGGAIAAAWAIMNHLGQEGYLDMARTVMETTTRLREGIQKMRGLKVLGDPCMSIFAIGSDGPDIYEIGDELALRGWFLDRQQLPASLHLTVTPAHAEVAGAFLDDLEQAVTAARSLSPGRLARSAQVGLARAVINRLPPGLVSRLAKRAGEFSGMDSGQQNQRRAAIYGLMASLPDRGDVGELALDIIDRLTRPGEQREDR